MRAAQRASRRGDVTRARAVSGLRAATLAVFVLAALLRLVLACVNREQSDNHVSVIDVMAFEHRIPDYDRDRDEVKEAFQPKLYHGTVAAILRLDPSTGTWRPCVSEYPGSPHVVWIGQMVNATAGILTLFVVLRFLDLQDVSNRTRFFAFALVALNPALVAINAQVTNDSFVILFGSLTLSRGYRFFRDFRRRDFVCMTAAAIAAAMSKATGLPICLAIVLVFAIALAHGSAAGAPRSSSTLGYAAVFAGALLAALTVVAPKLGSYAELYHRYGSPFVTNRLPEPFPRPFAPTVFTGDAGVRSIAESLFTFRIVDLLRHPVVGNGRGERFPLHRTSVWSQVYGRLSSIRFDDYLETWRPLSAAPTNLARAALVLGLFPAALLALGVATAVARAAASPRRVRPHEWLIGMAAAGSTAFLIALALRYRDYTFFKPILAFGGLAAFAALFARGYDSLGAAAGRRWSAYAGSILLAALVLAYALDDTLLAAQLFASCRSPGGFPQ
ncbi:MAG: hypothetical protein B6D46_00355 [Polyangiaceae bacterium UTPRO1]|nr:MAG: hypothetical protein B6D46_00355 [Polyangiaceae bacterium UTPRO1]